MFKNIKLGTKIALSFVTILGIALLLGGISIVVLNSIKSGNSELTDGMIPELKYAGKIERHLNKINYEMRGYIYTEENEFYETGMRELSELKKTVYAAESMPGKPDELKKLKEKTNGINLMISEIEAELKKRKESIDELKNERKNMDNYVKDFTESCYKLLDVMEQRFKLENTAKFSASKTEEKYKKTEMVKGLMASANEIMGAALKSQAMRKPKYIEDALFGFGSIERGLSELRKYENLENSVRLLDNIEKAGNGYKKSLEKIASVGSKLLETDKSSAERFNEIISLAVNLNDRVIEKTVDFGSRSSFSLSITAMAAAFGFAVLILLGIILSVIMRTSIIKAIDTIFRKIRKESEQMEAAFVQMSFINKRISDNTEVQSNVTGGAAVEVGKAIEKSQKIMLNSEKAVALSQNISESVTEHVSEMAEMQQSMDELKKSGIEISRIIKIIDDMAFQINILALNAAVEAARAGDSGTEFSVVAEEIKNFAQKSALAAKETAAIIEKNLEISDKGEAGVKKAVDSLSEITGNIKKVNEFIENLCDVSREQLQNFDKINGSIKQIEQNLRRASTDADETEAVSEELAIQASIMREAVTELEIMINGPKAAADYGEYNKSPVSGRLREGAQTGIRHVPNEKEKTVIINSEEILPVK